MYRALIISAWLWSAASASAGSDTTPPSEIEVVIVTGEQPGPGLWKVANAEGHALWLLGTVNPKPKGITWRSSEVAGAVAASQEVLRQADEMPARVDIDVDTINPLKKLRAVRYAKRLQDQKKDLTPLQARIPAALYERYMRVRHEYLPDSAPPAGTRPGDAASYLYGVAIGRAGLSSRAVIHEEVERIAGTHRVRVRDVSLEVKVDIETAMQIATETSEAPLDADVACLEETVTQLESQLPVIAARANAWALGDIAALRNLPYLTRKACSYAPWSTPRWQDLPQRLVARWLEVVEDAMARNDATFVLVDISELLRPDGLLAALAARGYAIVAPLDELAARQLPITVRDVFTQSSRRSEVVIRGPHVRD